VAIVIYYETFPTVFDIIILMEIFKVEKIVLNICLNCVKELGNFFGNIPDSEFLLSIIRESKLVCEFLREYT